MDDKFKEKNLTAMLAALNLYTFDLHAKMQIFTSCIANNVNRSLACWHANVCFFSAINKAQPRMI